nr:MucBP domain-containing protein [Streptococcus suis]
MRKAKKKTFNWYGMRQHFSIRKYHFGAASVLLGMSLALGAGGQAVKAEETAASSEALASTTATSSTQASSEVAPATSVEATTTTATETAAPAATTTEVAATERTATINYIVQYLLEDGTLVEAVVKSATVKTTDSTAKTTVDVTAELPEGYILAEGQEEISSHEITEGAENLVTIKVVKKAEVASTTTEAPAATTTATAPAAPAATTPATAEEAKVVLEQNISEAQVLSNEADRLVATSDSDNSALKTAANATKLAASEATKVLKDSVATLETVNAQINAVRSNVEALALELRKFLGTEDIQVSLAVVTGASLGGKGTGVQVLAGPTVGPSMDDPNGAAVTSTTSGTLKPTETAGYTTFKFFPLGGNGTVWYDNTVGVPRGYGGKSTDGAYLRASVAKDASDEILVELVDKNGNVLETHIMSPTQTAEFTHFQAQSANIPIIASYSADSISDSAFGTLLVTFDKNTISPNSLIPKLITNTTSYVTENGETLGTYTMVTMPGLTNTPSGVREFSGYEFVKTTTSTVEVSPVAGAPYVEQVRQGYPLNWADGGPYFQYKTIVRPVAGEKAVVKEIWIADPNYTGTHDYSTTSEDGFIKIITTSKMGIGQSNTEFMLDPGLIGTYKVTTQAGGTLRELTDASQLNLSTLGNNEWIDIRFRNEASGLSHLGITNNGSGGVNYLQLHFGRDRRPGDTPDTMLGITLPVTLRYAGVNMTETTHVYKPVIQEAIIRYQVQGAADFLEDSGTLTGNPGTDITYSTEATINKYKKLGYELVSDNFTADAGQDYDYDTAVKQEFLVVIKPRVVEVPKGAVPGDPVDPTDPNSPVWPATVENLETTQEVTRTVEYKYEDGTPVRVDAAGNVLPKDSTEGTPLVKTETVTFTRPAQVNLVTGEVTYGEWVADTTDTLKGNVLPQVPGYTASSTTLEGADAPMTETVKDKTVTATDADINEVVYYKENPKYGDVVVNYVNTDGKVIASPVIDTNEALVGTEYSTADRVPKKIIEDATGDVYYYKEIKPEDAAKETGKVVEGTTEVTYVYEKAGNVVVNYVDENGNPLSGTTNTGAPTASTVNDTVDGKPGTEYDTKDLKPTTITTADGKVYELVPASTKGTEAGKVEAGKTTEVTYVYKEVKGNVIVNYVDENGNPISGVTDAGKETASTVEDTPETSTGTKYDTTDLRPNTITTADGKIYKLVPSAVPSNETGTVTPGTTEVTYVYELVQGDVVVHYEDKEGNPIAKDVTDTKVTDTGTAYDTTDNKPEKIIDDTTGEVYYILPKDEVKAGSAPETGKVTEGTTEVTYVYEKAGNVVVNYVTEDGTPIKTPVNDETNAKPGSDYNTTDNKPTEITGEDGSRYVLIPSKTIGPETGSVEGGKTTEITYVYKKVANWIPEIPATPENPTPVNPVIPYPFDPKDPDKPIDPTTPYPDGNVPSIPHVPGFTPVDPKTNEPLKPVDPTDPSKGYVPPTPDESGKDTPIPYVQTGNVVVNYVTEDGTPIKRPVNDETNAPAGKSYDTTDNKPNTITTEDGTTYELVRVDGPETGTVVGGKTTEVTYVYRKVETPTKKVVTNHVDEETGLPIALQEEGTRPNKSIPGYEFTGKTVTDPNGNTTHIYRKVTKVVTNHVDENGNPIAPQEEGTTPNKSIPGYEFTGKTVTDPNGNTTHIYRKVTKVVTNHVDENGNPIAPQEDGTTPNKSIPGYEFTGKTVTDPNGNTTHIYRKVTKVVTNHVDENGNPIAPQEEGTTPNKSIPGYEFTGKTVTDPDGNTTHIYRKVTKVVTNHVDENGNPIAPQEDGTTPNKSIPGYEFTGKTVTDPDGNTTHIYRKVTKVVTNHVDENGNPIAPQEDGTTPNKSIPGYEFTGKTVTDPNGNTTHIYRKVSNPAAPNPQAPSAPAKPSAPATPAKAGAAQLPNTGEASSSAAVLGVGMLVAALALAGKRRRKED